MIWCAFNLVVGFLSSCSKQKHAHKLGVPSKLTMLI